MFRAFLGRCWRFFGTPGSSWQFPAALGQPYVVDESLARRRPVVIFEDIAHIVKERKGIFVSKRNINSFCETINHVMQNYNKIQKNIEGNKFVTKEDMLKQISGAIG